MWDKRLTCVEVSDSLHDLIYEKYGDASSGRALCGVRELGQAAPAQRIRGASRPECAMPLSGRRRGVNSCRSPAWPCDQITDA